MSELGQALARVKRALEGEAVPYVVVGGLAAIIWGEERLTIDVDVTIDVERVGLEGFLRVARSVGEPLPEDPVTFADRNRFLPVRTPSGIRVDLMIATLPFESDAIARAIHRKIEGVAVPLCTPEDLIVYKMVSDRGRDHDDIVGILRKRGKTLDLGRLDAFARGAAEDLAEPEIARRWRAAKQAAGLR